MKTKEKRPQPKIGRPRKVVKSSNVRISPHFPEAIAERVRQAAAWRGVPLAVFVLEAAAQRADEVIEREQHLRFSAEEWKKMRALMAAPPKPTPSARKAAQFLASHVEIRP